MRIAYYNPVLSESWGAGVHARELAKAWRALGHEVLGLPGDSVNACREAAEQGFAWGGKLGMVVGRDLKRRACARTHLPDLTAELDRFTPDVAVYRRVDHDYVADATLPYLGVPYIAEVNAVASVERERLHGRGSMPGERTRERRYLDGARRVICAASDIADEVREIGAHPRELRVVHNGVDTELFAPEARPNARAQAFSERFEFVVAYCATPSPVHDFDKLLRAAGSLARSNPDVGFLFVGPDEAMTLPRLKQAGVEESRVLCTGRVEHDAVPGHLVTADVLWGAMNKETNLSLKVFEYMGLGKPVAMASSGIEPSPVVEADAGLVVPRGDAEGLAQAVRELLAEPVRAAVLGSNGRAWVQQHATWKAVAARMIEGILE